MILKRAGALLALCFCCMAAAPDAAPAAQFGARERLIQQNLAGLQEQLRSSSCDDSAALRGLTVEFLDELKRPGDRVLPVLRYVAAVQDQAGAAALDAQCAPALLMSIATNGANMLQELATTDPPVCEALSLSTGAAVIMAAKYDYDICVENTLETPDAAVIADLEARKKNLQVYTFSADVLSLLLCSATITAQDIVALLTQLISLL